MVFCKLKNTVTLSTILHLPDPTSPLTLDGDASETEMGAILSQCFGNKPKMHLGFLFQELFLAEQNYDIGNRELLAVKLTLQEWRCWLKGAAHLFTILKAHKNFKYLNTAKCLNAQQACGNIFSIFVSISLCHIVPDRKILNPMPLPCWHWQRDHSPRFNFVLRGGQGASRHPTHAAAHATTSMVSHCTGLLHQPTWIPRHTGHPGQFLMFPAAHLPASASHVFRAAWACIYSCVWVLWHHGGHQRRGPQFKS